MNAARLDSDENIACLLCVGLKYLVLINNADRETCEVVLLLGHKTGVLGSFTAYERAACLNAAVSHARNDLCYLFGDILSAGNIIEEKLWLCAAADYIINAHCNTVDTYGVMLVHDECYLYLCTNAVSTRNENRLAYACHIKLEKSAETADTGKRSRCHCAGNVALHKLYSLVTRCYVNTGLFIAFRKTVVHRETSVILIIVIGAGLTDTFYIEKYFRQRCLLGKRCLA